MTSTDTRAAVQSPAAWYLDQAGQHLTQIREQVPHLADFGDRMAEPLVAGGEIFAPPVAPYWPSEFGGRAGGLMGLRRGRHHTMCEGDVAYFALPDPARWDPREDETLQRLIDGPAHLFVNGRPEDLAALGDLDRFAAFTGGADPREGAYRFGSIDPLVGFRELEQFARGWTAAGEMIAGCVRRGRMPTVYMSVWMEGAKARNGSFMQEGNLEEPWDTPLFHENWYIQPPEPGSIARQFLDEAERLRQVLLTQQARLEQAGRWLAEARDAGRRTWVVAVGHSYPKVLQWPEDEEAPLEFGRSISHLVRSIPADLAEGDTVLHLGYAPFNADHARHWLDRGVRLIHTSPYGPGPELVDHDNFLWLDLPWRPGDATVDLPGYSARLLPMSSTAQTMAWYAILSEVAERMTWR